MSRKSKATATKEEAKPALVPNLRFPEFRGTEGWTTNALGDVCKLYQAETIASSEFIADGEHLVYGANGVVGRLNRFNHEAEEVVVSCRGNCGEVHLTKPKSWITGNAMVVSPKSHDLTKRFLFRLLGAANLRPVISGSAQPQITRQGFSPFEVSIPLPTEQQKIAECLSSVDELMAAQARKVDALKTHKKGLMQQLFPREGESQPRLRFPEFQNAGEWEVKPLGELVELQSGYAFSSAYFGSEGRKLVTPKNFTKSGHGNFDESVSKYTTEDVPDRFVCKPGDLLVLLTDLTPTCELLGKPLLLEEEDGTVLLNQRVVRVEASASKLATSFLKYVFLSDAYSSLIIKTATGSTVRHSSNKVLLEMQLVHPSLPEQQRIATCLNSLDALITAETQKHEALKTHKKGLMQQLFPYPEEVES